jgi:hypothetical protein
MYRTIVTGVEAREMVAVNYISFLLSEGLILFLAMCCDDTVVFHLKP